MEMIPCFGVATGKDGALYSVYPPVESIFLAPLIGLGNLIIDAGLYEGTNAPLSHYVDNGFWKHLARKPTTQPRIHQVRFLVSFFNVFISALAVAVFWMILRLLIKSDSAATVTALLFGFGTIFWQYSGTIFSESLATLLILISFYGLIKNDSAVDESFAKPRLIWLAVSGLCLGLAVGTHVTSILFAPFFGFHLLFNSFKENKNLGKAIPQILVWCAFIGFIFFLLGYYNYIRFGSFFESGRSLSAYNPVVFHMPWTGKYWVGFKGLLLSSGKGLLLFSPAVILALPGWRGFYKKHSTLSILLAGAIIFRIFFISSYDDWHAGFCLGPRYLLMCMPFMILPVGYWLKESFDLKNGKTIQAFLIGVCVLVSQQIYFVVTDIFSYYQITKLEFMKMNLNVFKGDRLHLDWELSPLFNLFKGPKGPFWLHNSDYPAMLIWLIASGLALVLILGTYSIYNAKNK